MGGLMDAACESSPASGRKAGYNLAFLLSCQRQKDLRRYSSVGESAGFITPRSVVQIHLSPPRYVEKAVRNIHLTAFLVGKTVAAVCGELQHDSQTFMPLPGNMKGNKTTVFPESGEQFKSPQCLPISPADQPPGRPKGVTTDSMMAKGCTWKLPKLEQTWTDLQEVQLFATQWM